MQVQRALQVPLLGRSQVVVEKHDVRVQGIGEILEFLNLAGADQGRRFGSGPRLDDPVEDGGARAARQGGQLGQGLLRAGRSRFRVGTRAPGPAALELHPDKYGAFLQVLRR